MPRRLLLLIRMDKKDLLSFIVQFIRSDSSNLYFLGCKNNDWHFSNYFGISICLGEGSKSPVILGKERRAFSSSLPRNGALRLMGLEGMEDASQEPAQHPSAVPSLCAQQKGCFPTGNWRKNDEQRHPKEERMSSETVSPACLPGHSNLHNVIVMKGK